MNIHNSDGIDSSPIRKFLALAEIGPLPAQKQTVSSIQIGKRCSL